MTALLDRGNRERTTGATAMNAASSRSHSIILLEIVRQVRWSRRQRNPPRTHSPPPPTQSLKSKIALVDLAGSEKTSAAETTGTRLKEGININKSLSCLGQCIAALAKESNKTGGAPPPPPPEPPVKGKKKTTRRKTSPRGPHVPFRDSVLTLLLKDGLTGNSSTLLLATLSPAGVNYSDTLSTLRFANSAKAIKTHATVNEDPAAALIKKLQAECATLRQQIISGGAAPKSGGGVADSISTNARSSLIAGLQKKINAHLERSAQQVANTQALRASMTVIGPCGGDESSPYLINLSADASRNRTIVVHVKPVSCAFPTRTQSVPLGPLCPLTFSPTGRRAPRRVRHFKRPPPLRPRDWRGVRGRHLGR